MTWQVFEAELKLIVCWNRSKARAQHRVGLEDVIFILLHIKIDSK